MKTWKTKWFGELTAAEIYGILRSRSEIFVVEQNCIYQDPDGKDPEALHVFCEENGRVTACLRAFRKDPETVQMGRVLTLKHGTGLGGELLKRGVREIREQMRPKRIYLEAQTYATGFYAREGFRVSSDEFLEDGIPHVKMVLDCSADAVRNRDEQERSEELGARCGMAYIIETERLGLREYTPDDFEALYEIMSDPETMQHYPAPFDRERTEKWIAWNLDNYAKYGFGLWAVVLKETGEFIGDCGITIQNIDGEMLPEIGYHIHKKYWRRGYAKEAARAVRDWVFLHTEYDAVYSYMKYSNVASWSTAMANGMLKVKEYPDPKNTVSYAFAITRAEWQALHGAAGCSPQVPESP